MLAIMKAASESDFTENASFKTSIMFSDAMKRYGISEPRAEAIALLADIKVSEDQFEEEYMLEITDYMGRLLANMCKGIEDSFPYISNDMLIEILGKKSSFHLA